jgi:PmbA protein
MLENIKQILTSSTQIDGWKIIERKVKSSELFFIRKELDMNRGKNVHHFKVTVYKDFEENGVKYRGSSTTNIHPTMSTPEIKKVIEEAAFAAQFVKNKYYPLVKPSNIKQPNVLSKFSEAPLSNWIPDLVNSIYKEDTHKNGWINSTELFLNKIYTRIVNSEGVDVSFESFKGEIEIITNWQEKSEEIELYKNIKFANFKPEIIAEKVKKTILLGREKALAKPTPALKKYTVLLSGEPVKEFFKYYYYQSNAQYIYDELSSYKLNENIQGNSVKGDLINLKLDPFLESSTESEPYDESGYPLKPVSIIENGILKGLWGDARYSYYLNVEPTGYIKNFIVEGGNKSIKNMKQEPYLEIAVFSDFSMDSLTGDFYGEIRLGWYYDGNKVIPVTGGSISGNIKEVQENMYLSKELQTDNEFLGPKMIQLFNINVSGC